MTEHESRIGPSGREDAVTSGLRSIYAAPDDAGFWDRLETRIMARIEAEGDVWWTAFQDWVSAGLVAATVAMVVAGLTIAHVRTNSTREAYQSLIERPRTLAHQMATETTPLPDREATLRLVTAP
jgi:hypothetical protein